MDSKYRNPAAVAAIVIISMCEATRFPLTGEGKHSDELPLLNAPDPSQRSRFWSKHPALMLATSSQDFLFSPE
jgi:hypothetical protein